MNLLEETISVLTEHNKTEKDVLWVGNDEIYTTWENFKSIANIDYDNGFGGQEVAIDIMIVGSNWWLSRSEYDGSEWWDFHTKPRKPRRQVTLTSVIVENKGWNTKHWLNLMDLNNIKN